MIGFQDTWLAVNTSSPNVHLVGRDSALSHQDGAFHRSSEFAADLQAIGSARDSSSPGIYIQLADHRRLTLKPEVGGSLGQDEANNACF